MGKKGKESKRKESEWTVSNTQSDGDVGSVVMYYVTDDEEVISVTIGEDLDQSGAYALNALLARLNDDDKTNLAISLGAEVPPPFERMSRRQKHLAVLNYIHNELDISAGTIKEWCMDAAAAKAEKQIGQINFQQIADRKIESKIEALFRSIDHKSIMALIKARVIKMVAATFELATSPNDTISLKKKAAPAQESAEVD